MKLLDYETAMVGKWHLKEEPAEFDYFCVLPGQGKYHDPDFRVRGEQAWPNNEISFKGHSSDMITNITLEWLDNIRDKGKPFFLMHHYKAPHDMFDFAPTIIEMAGRTVPGYMQGESHKSIIETRLEPEGWKQATYYRYWMHMAHRHANPAHFGIRTKNYKLIFLYGVFYKDTRENSRLYRR